MADPIVLDPKRVETLGPADRLIGTILTYADHLRHGRPGIVIPAPNTPIGVTWESASYKEEAPTPGAAPVKVAYFNRKVGTKTTKVRAGILQADGRVLEGTRIVGQYRQPGFSPEVAAWTYKQVAAIYKLDNEFVARWASHAFGEEHRDLKVVLCAFLLVQGRKGDPIMENGEMLFKDEDYRDVGEAMCLIRKTDNKDLNPKMVLLVGEFLRLPVIAAINRELGFGRSAKNPTLGRWDKTVSKWLLNRERNPKMLDGLVKGGMRTTVVRMAQRVHYKPSTPRFYEVLRWKQVQAKDGRRTLSIGATVAEAESWEGLTEAEVCQRIVDTKPSFKRVVGLLPKKIGLSRAVVAAAVEAGSMSNQDLIILTPTLEELGLVNIEPVKSRWENAMKTAENQRAANIAQRVKTVAVKEKLEAAAEVAVTKAVAEVVKGLHIYFMVDISGSMQNAIEQAKIYVGQLLGGFPADKVHVSVFNTAGREVSIKHPSKAGVEAAFRGIAAGGGTDYGSGVRALQQYKPGADEDALFIFVGDEQASDFSDACRKSGLNPAAFGLLKVSGSDHDNCVRQTAVSLGIPCFPIDAGIFQDPYAITRTLRNLISATPVGRGVARAVPAARESLVERILRTPILAKPAWASVQA